ncbi:hypothetical protein WJX74_006385 [Apatococcus lobatus]|uniref:Protein kinase domain-containing protein n=1 Tax=Apatococcus lobatus TaxID=904363 RepID=A0AAW1S677_9CHLO
MEVLGFEIWREGTKLEESGYEAPLTRDEALGALQEENPLWTGKLTVKDSQLGLRGPRKLDPSKVHVLRLANLAGAASSIEGVSSGVLADHLAQPLPKADAATYKGNQEEEDRFQHPSRVQDWPSLPAQARAPGIRCSGGRRGMPGASGLRATAVSWPADIQGGRQPQTKGYNPRLLRHQEAEDQKETCIVHIGRQITIPNERSGEVWACTAVERGGRAPEPGKEHEVGCAVGGSQVKAESDCHQKCHPLSWTDRRSKLLVSSAISCAQRSGPDCLSVTEALVFAMLSAHDEDSAGPQQPYPAAVQPGQPPHTVPPTMPKDEDMLGLQDSAVGRGAFCVPVPATASACAGSPVDGFSLADLHLGPPIARQIYHAILDGRPVVVRMGFTPRQRRHVDTEARALRAMHALQGADVPRLLAHGRMREGFAYAVTEYIDGRCWDGSSAADRSLGDQLRTGLTHIYQHGVIQNDVKPDNILVEHATGRPIFIDFALAKHSPDPEAHESEDSELHAMLGQAEPDWPVGHFSSILLLLRASD